MLHTPGDGMPNHVKLIFLKFHQVSGGIDRISTHCMLAHIHPLHICTRPHTHAHINIHIHIRIQHTHVHTLVNTHARAPAHPRHRHDQVGGTTIAERLLQVAHDRHFRGCCREGCDICAQHASLRFVSGDLICTRIHEAQARANVPRLLVPKSGQLLFLFVFFPFYR